MAIRDFKHPEIVAEMMKQTMTILSNMMPERVILTFIAMPAPLDTGDSFGMITVSDHNGGPGETSMILELAKKHVDNSINNRKKTMN